MAPAVSDRVPTPFVLAANGGRRTPRRGRGLPAPDRGRRAVPGQSVRPSGVAVRRRPARSVRARAACRPAAVRRVLVGAVVSLSPERFLRRAGATCGPSRSRARARAHRLRRRPRGRRARRSLASTKDAAEHVMIVDLMRNDLGRVCAYGTVRAARAPHRAPRRRLAPRLDSPRRACATACATASCCARSFPPGSVTGAPKVQAMKVIATLEATAARGLHGRDRDRQPDRRARPERRDPHLRDRAATRSGSASAARSWPTPIPSRSSPRRSTRRPDRSRRSAGRLVRPLERRRRTPRTVRVSRARGGARAAPRAAARPGARRVRDRARRGRPPVALEQHLARLAASVAELYGATLPSTVLAGPRR